MKPPRPRWCCGVCPEVVSGGVDCTCRNNPRCRGPVCAQCRRADGTHKLDCTAQGGEQSWKDSDYTSGQWRDSVVHASRRLISATQEVQG